MTTDRRLLSSEETLALALLGIGWMWFAAGCSVDQPAASPTVVPGSGAEAGGSSVGGAGSVAASPAGAPSATTADSAASPPESGATVTSEAKPAGPPSTTAHEAPAGGVAATSTEAEKISFDDLNCGIQADIVFRDWMLTERAKQLDKKRVRIAGYMLPDAKQAGIKEFVLLRNTECKFGPMGQADHLIRVNLKPGVTTRFSIEPIEVTGVLTINPYTGPDQLTWSIYDLEGDLVGPVRR